MSNKIKHICKILSKYRFTHIRYYYPENKGYSYKVSAKSKEHKVEKIIEISEEDFSNEQSRDQIEQAANQRIFEQILNLY